MKGNMTEGKPLELILRFSIPLLLGNIFQQTYNMVDTAIVGQTLGANALASVGSTSSVQFLVLGFCIGSCTGFAIPVAQHFGGQNYTKMRHSLFVGAVLAACIALVMASVTSYLCTNILHLLSVPEEIMAMAYQYLIVILIGIPFTVLYNFLSGVLRAIGDSKTPFMFLAFSAVLNIFLDFFCILVLNWGVSGAAIATIVSQAISGLLCLYVIIRKFDILHIHREERYVDGQTSLKLLTMAVPMGLQFSITAIGSMVLQSANNALGTIYVSGFTAGMKIKQFMMCPFDAFGTAVSTFASQNFGAGKFDRIKQGVKQGLMIAVGYGIVAGIIMMLFGRTMSLLFVKADAVDVLDASYKYAFRMGMFWWSLGILNTLRMTIQGLGYAGRAVFGGVIEMIGRVVVSMIFVPVYGFDAITFADQVAWVGACLYLVPMYFVTLRAVQRKLEQDQIFNTLQN